MHDPHTDPAQVRRQRFRYTLAAMMTFIALTSLILTLTLPLIREGRPPCMSAGRTVRWLASNPGAVRCADCHEQPGPRRSGDIRPDESSPTGSFRHEDSQTGPYVGGRTPRG
jgi:hypothetical protein